VAKYSVELKPTARKELEKLPDKLIERIFPKLEALADDPRREGCYSLRHATDLPTRFQSAPLSTVMGTGQRPDSDPFGYNSSRGIAV
jgi:mRNA-degrading endonuclease RelE of RelBE toxin-antitoxin system